MTSPYSIITIKRTIRLLKSEPIKNESHLTWDIYPISPFTIKSMWSCQEPLGDKKKQDIYRI